MADITFRMGDIYWVFLFIGAMFTVWKIFKEMVKPYREMQRKVDKEINDMLIAKRELENSKKNDQAIMKSLLAMIDHMITGNGIENMKKIKKELTDYIIEEGREKND